MCQHDATMNDERIARLIARRDKLTNRRDERINRPAVAEIDAQLEKIEPGQRNDVDLLLGRSCAQLPTRCNRRVVLAQHVDGAREVEPAFGLTAADMKRIAEDAMQNQPPIEY